MRTARVYQTPAVPYHTLIRGSLSTPSTIPFQGNAQYNTKQTSFDKNSDGRNEAHARRVASVRHRLYSIAEYMKMIKQWFSEDYNSRHGHKGTMWSSAYGDEPDPMPERIEEYDDLRDILAYIHLNPVRAGLTDAFDDFVWSSYTAYRKGDPEAVAGMHLAYPDLVDADIVTIHESRMSRLLSADKRERALEIARKLNAGIAVERDRLTSEVMVAQAQEQLSRIQKLIVELHAERMEAKKVKGRNEILCQQVICELMAYPTASAAMLSSLLGVHERSIYRCVKSLCDSGVISRKGTTSPWKVNFVKLGQTHYHPIA